MEKQKQRPHAVCIPYPAQGHINPMLNLAKHLHSHAGFHVTFVNTHYNHHRLLRAGGGAPAGHPSFRFESIPDGLPGSDDGEVTQDVQALCVSVETNFLGPYRDLIEKLNDTASSGVPPVTCLVSDVAMYFTHGVAKELGVPNVMLFPASISCLSFYLVFDKLLQMGILPLKKDNNNGELDMILPWVPAASDIRLRDFPTFVRITDINDYVFNFILRMIKNIKKASAIVFNSFETLEYESLKSFPSDFPPLYAIGPLKLMLDKNDDTETKSIKSNLWKENPNCIEWLDSRESCSVVYVNFGSITVMTNEQLVEFAWGLANSKQPFLWIARPDLVMGENVVLPSKFIEETKKRGFIAEWCDQEKVLSHPAIGGFLTHCGWNSTMESIYNGVPMICWPFFADQQTNCWYSCTKWGIGVEIDSNVKRDEIESQVKDLMIGEKGKEMRRKAMEWKRLALEATQSSSGSSYSNFDDVVKVLLSKK